MLLNDDLIATHNVAVLCVTVSHDFAAHDIAVLALNVALNRLTVDIAVVCYADVLSCQVDVTPVDLGLSVDCHFTDDVHFLFILMV